MRPFTWIFLIGILVLMLACNLPSGVTPTPVGDSPALPSQVGTAVDLTPVVQVTDSAPSLVPAATRTVVPAATRTVTLPPTACYPQATATANANVRSGPGTAYDIVGFLMLGSSAKVAGKNDAGTWWYIIYAGASGGHAWIAGSVVTASCLPAVVQVVAAPPLPPTAVPTNTNVPPVAAKPDLYVSEYSWSPKPPHMGVSFHVRIGAYNQGNAPAGAFTVEWWLSTTAPAPACTWDVASLAAHGGRILECDYTPAGWANYPSQVVVDSGNSVVESLEGNNVWSEQLSIQP